MSAVFQFFLEALGLAGQDVVGRGGAGRPWWVRLAQAFFVLLAAGVGAALLTMLVAVVLGLIGG